MDSGPSDIGATHTAVRQHGGTKVEPEVERAEMLKGEKKGGEKQGEMSEQKVERRETEAGEQEGIEKAQSEVQDPAPHPTARAAANARLHEPVRFDWAAEVDEAHGLSPAVPSNPTTSTPINPAPGDPAIDPDRTAHTGTVPANSIPVPTSPMPTDPVPVNPVPGDATVDPVRTASANAVPTDPAPVYLANPDPGDVTVDPVHTAFANVMPADPVPVDPTPVSPTNPVHIPFTNTIPSNFTTITSVYPDLNPMHPTSVSAALVDPDPNPVEPEPESTAPVDPSPCGETVHPALVDTICNTPVEPVHVDPVSVISTDSTLISGIIGFAFITFGHQTHLPSSRKPSLFGQPYEVVTLSHAS